MPRPFKHADKIKELAGWIKPVREVTPREQTPRERLRTYPELVPTPADIRWAKRVTRIGSPTVAETVGEILDWAKAHWPWLAGGAILYFGLLAAALRKKA